MIGKPIALHLADELEHSHGHALALNAAAELRCLHAANIDCVDHFNALMKERNELLQALKYLVAVYDKGTCGTTVEIGFNNARSAIAKATGAKT